MASVRKEVLVEAPPAHVWAAIRDFGGLRERLVPGFVTDVKLEDGARIVTFANGSTSKELLVACDDERRRLVYAVTGGRVTQHSASVEALDEGEGRTRFVWTTDFLPNELERYIDGQMEAGIAIIKRTLERAFVSGAAR